MRGTVELCFWSALVLGAQGFSLDNAQVHQLGAQGVNLWKLNRVAEMNRQSELSVQDPDSQTVFQTPLFEERWFEQPLDHFAKDSPTFQQRYWVNDRHWRSGGPVFVLDGGETSGVGRLPFLDTGIMEILSNATGGLGIVLEHRYYGESVPVMNLTTDSLRWLTNEQSAADSAHFIANVKIDGIEEDITAPNTPWIYYGGSYAGARAAHMRVLYPDLVFGAIGSSAVTHAAIELWEYMDLIREAADPECSKHLQDSIAQVDTMLSTPGLRRPIKALFGLADLEHDEDFVSLLQDPLGAWQAKNWDPTVGSTSFDAFCEALSKPPMGWSGEKIHLPGGLSVDFSVLNYAKWIKEHTVSLCPDGVSVEECFGTYDDSKFQGTDLSQTWRLWMFQVCTQWGYFFTAPPDQEYPRIVSNRLTLEYQTRVCAQAYPDGEHFSVPSLPNITAVNALGDFAIAADRLALIDGEVDPWRPATPHSQYALDRKDTLSQPFKLIPYGVHHWDENGLKNPRAEPWYIQKIHAESVEFVTEWLKEWKAAHT